MKHLLLLTLTNINAIILRSNVACMISLVCFKLLINTWFLKKPSCIPKYSNSTGKTYVDLSDNFWVLDLRPTVKQTPKLIEVLKFLGTLHLSVSFNLYFIPFSLYLTICLSLTTTIHQSISLYLSCFLSLSIYIKCLSPCLQNRGQSYKHFTLVNNDSRVVPDLKILHVTTLGS